MTRLSIFVLGVVASSQLLAAQLDVVPTAWRLENNIPDRPVVWFSGSTCGNGELTFPANATDQDKNRFWATIMAAKTAGKKVFVFYNENSSDCEISSFGMLEG